ncbi:peptidoglycan-binding domain-containing protein [Bacillus atrophaeus]|uniref:peptidoglycan-binding domain-containing protein n=1 Tax=Bacillus atrophaeus TaxID=1452 RepID=UPI00227DE4F7|nr:peptidoglycan-binding domain-containing protein [Bacillus atrophaeus]MCY8856437.1 peptidoglycan-binding protein [Bacillus atrophaeus]
MRNVSTGFLNVTINNKNQADPIIGAKVTITEYKNRNKIIKTSKTNEAGQINLIELEALNPSDIYSGNPYKKYDLIVEIPPTQRLEHGKTYVKSGIQIMNNVITNSEDDLSYITALENAKDDRRILEIDLPENNIFLSEVEQMYMDPYTIPDKLVPGSSSYAIAFPKYVKPFVPTKINIYLGKVNPYNPVIKVNERKIILENYKKYLKIVSAKEFGGIPNLTEQAAIAQFLCVNSFALNRVYTELYINKGFKFNITNSKSFDQDYPAGGQSFDHIDKIVDKYFNKYIRITEKVQPFLAQYCTGKSGVCQNRGLPLLHCNDLSIRNPQMSYLDLLKYYFKKGDVDIEIIETHEVEGIPKSYPGFNLKIGMTTDENSINSVKAIQTWLNIIRKNYNAIPNIQETGIFDNQTFVAVKKFQELFEKTKPEKGIVDETTWYKISEKYVAASGIAEPREILNNYPQTYYLTYVEWVPVMMPVYVPMYRYSNFLNRHKV